MAPEKDEAVAHPIPDLGESLDKSTFEQILDMDDDESEREFSRSIVFGFFEQAEATFMNIDQGLKNRDLEDLSSLGHYLKGSSATLGLNSMRNSCEKIQHLGKLTDETGARPESEESCLEKIRAELIGMKIEYKKVELALKDFYGEGDSAD